MKSLPWTTVELMWVAILVTVGVPHAAAAESAGTRNVVRQAGPGRWALLIGVDQYAWAKSLDFCGADMQALGDQLASSGFPRDHVYLLHDKAAESVYRPLRANIDRQLKLVLGLVERGDLVVVAFSGHGVHLQGKSFLCPGDAQLDDRQSLVSLDSVYESLQQSPAALKLLLVDACRNDPRLGGERTVKPTEGTRQFAASLEPPRGILLMTSCAPGEIAREEKDFGHGVFMHFLLEGLGGKADVNGSGGVSLMESYLYARDKTKTYVARKFVDSQRPGLKGDIEDDFDLTQVLGPAKELTNSLGMKLLLIQPGELMMGTPSSDVDRLVQAFPDLKREYLEDEHPQHSVRISKPFYLGAYEVTVGQFRRFVESMTYKTEAEQDGKGGFGWNESAGKFEQDARYTWRNPGFGQTDDHPVTNVSWNDATAFCRWLSGQEGRTYRLPTEAEWEYACRAGTTSWYSCGNDPEGLAAVGNVADGTAKAKYGDWSWAIQSRDGYVYTAPVGQFRANAFGLYDMHGNVYEWCADWYGEKYYGESAPDDPRGPTAGSVRVIRGGGWDGDPRFCRSAFRYWSPPEYRFYYLGFRVASSSVDASSK